MLQQQQEQQLAVEQQYQQHNMQFQSSYCAVDTEVDVPVFVSSCYVVTQLAFLHVRDDRTHC